MTRTESKMSHFSSRWLAMWKLPHSFRVQFRMWTLLRGEKKETRTKWVLFTNDTLSSSFVRSFTLSCLLPFTTLVYRLALLYCFLRFVQLPGCLKVPSNGNFFSFLLFCHHVSKIEQLFMFFCCCFELLCSLIYLLSIAVHSFHHSMLFCFVQCKRRRKKR